MSGIYVQQTGLKVLCHGEYCSAEMQTAENGSLGIVVVTGSSATLPSEIPHWLCFFHRLQLPVM